MTSVNLVNWRSFSLSHLVDHKFDGAKVLSKGLIKITDRPEKKVVYQYKMSPVELTTQLCAIAGVWFGFSAFITLEYVTPLVKKLTLKAVNMLKAKATKRNGDDVVGQRHGGPQRLFEKSPAHPMLQHSTPPFSITVHQLSFEKTQNANIRMAHSSMIN